MYVCMHINVSKDGCVSSRYVGAKTPKSLLDVIEKSHTQTARPGTTTFRVGTEPATSSSSRRSLNLRANRFVKLKLRSALEKSKFVLYVSTLPHRDFPHVDVVKELRCFHDLWGYGGKNLMPRVQREK